MLWLLTEACNLESAYIASATCRQSILSLCHNTFCSFGRSEEENTKDLWYLIGCSGRRGIILQVVKMPQCRVIKCDKAECAFFFFLTRTVTSMRSVRWKYTQIRRQAYPVQAGRYERDFRGSKPHSRRDRKSHRLSYLRTALSVGNWTNSELDTFLHISPRVRETSFDRQHEGNAGCARQVLWVALGKPAPSRHPLYAFASQRRTGDKEQWYVRAYDDSL